MSNDRVYELEVGEGVQFVGTKGQRENHEHFMIKGARLLINGAIFMGSLFTPRTNTDFTNKVGTLADQGGGKLKVKVKETLRSGVVTGIDEE